MAKNEILCTECGVWGRPGSDFAKSMGKCSECRENICRECLANGNDRACLMRNPHVHWVYKD